MSKSEDIKAVIFDAVRNYRYCGVTLEEIDGFAKHYLDKYSNEDRNSALVTLEREASVEKHGRKWFVHQDLIQTALGGSHTPEFEDFDFIILASILIEKKNASSLEDIIRNFDAIQRLVVTFDEIYGGINRLKSVSLISVRSGSFKSTKKSSLLWEMARSHSTNSLYDVCDALKRVVSCPCCGVSLKKVTWKVPIDENDYEKAYKSYQQSFSKSKD